MFYFIILMGANFISLYYYIKLLEPWLYPVHILIRTFENVLSLLLFHHSYRGGRAFKTSISYPPIWIIVERIT